MRWRACALRVMGEVSEFNDKPGYKAAYFTVSDGGAAMPCMMWRDAYIASGVELRCGMLVELAGNFSAYVPKGRMQFSVRSLTLAGEGNLRLQVAALARKLEARRAHATRAKARAARFPERIAVVTSPRGKAIHDVLRTLRRRYPLAELLVAGVAVEGDGAPAAIVEGMRVASDERGRRRAAGSRRRVVRGPDAVQLRGGRPGGRRLPGSGRHGHRARAGQLDRRHGRRPARIDAHGSGRSGCAGDERAERDADAGTSRPGSGTPESSSTAAQRVTRLAGRPVLRDPHAVLGPVAQRLDFAGMRLARAIPERLARDTQRVEYLRGRIVQARSAADRAPTRHVSGWRPRDWRTCRRSRFSRAATRRPSPRTAGPW